MVVMKGGATGIKEGCSGASVQNSSKVLYMCSIIGNLIRLYSLCFLIGDAFPDVKYVKSL